MQVQDAIHGYIQLNDLEEQIVDTPEMQRLRRVKQLGFSQLVYPSATHTRFEHSLGALHIAGKFADSLNVGEGRAQELRLAALLHDVGHGPFSHTADFIFHKNNTSHEAFSKQKIRDSAISDVLQDHGIHPKRITTLISGEGRLGSIIAGHIDVDRMDYLMRDAHYTGVAYGTVDEDTIIRSARIQDKQLVFDAKYVNALESLLMARYLMIPTVYTHRVSRIATRMFREAFTRLKQEEDIAVDELTHMDEPEVLYRMRQSDDAAWLINRIEERRLYKIAARFDDTDMTEQEIEAAIQEKTGLDDGEVLADFINRDDSTTYDVPVAVNGAIQNLEELSPLPAALKDALRTNSELRIYAPPYHVTDVADAAHTLLG